MSHLHHPRSALRQSNSGTDYSLQTLLRKPHPCIYSNHSVLPKYNQLIPVQILCLMFPFSCPLHNKGTYTGQNARGKWNARWILTAKAAARTRTTDKPHKKFPPLSPVPYCSLRLSATILHALRHLCTWKQVLLPTGHTGWHMQSPHHN